MAQITAGYFGEYLVDLGWKALTNLVPWANLVGIVVVRPCLTCAAVRTETGAYTTAPDMTYAQRLLVVTQHEIQII